MRNDEDWRGLERTEEDRRCVLFFHPLPSSAILL